MGFPNKRLKIDMKYKHKRLVGIVLLLLISVHFSLVIVYESPFFKKISGKLNAISFNYTYPYFHQSWELFVPPPKANHSLFVRYKNNASWSAWRDILKEETSMQKTQFMRGNEMIALTISTTCHFAKASCKEKNSQFQNVYQSTEVKVLDYMVSHYLINKNNLRNGDAYEFILYVKEPDKQYACEFVNMKIN